MRVLVLLLALALPASGATFRASDMSVVVISVAKWPAKAGLNGFTAEERQELDLVYALTARGVNDERITLMRDAEATSGSAREAIRKAAAGAKPGGVLLIYLQGHGLRFDGKTFLALYDYDSNQPTRTGLSLDELAKTIVDAWPGGSLILMGDFCYAGALAGVAQKVSKAGRGPAAAVCSAVASDRATIRWTFLDAVVQGLSGDVDVDDNGNGTITFQELSNWVISAMVHGEDQMAEVTMTQSFDKNLPLAKVAPHTYHAAAPDKRRPGDGIEAAAADGQWYAGRLLRFEDGRWRVRFSGMGPEEDEWVDPSRIRNPVKSPWRRGNDVEVEWVTDEWYAARVMEVAGGRMHFVHYENTDSGDDEWVPASRMRAPGGRLADGSTDGPLKRSRNRALRKRLK